MTKKKLAMMRRKGVLTSYLARFFRACFMVSPLFWSSMVAWMSLNSSSTSLVCLSQLRACLASSVPLMEISTAKCSLGVGDFDAQARIKGF